MHSSIAPLPIHMQIPCRSYIYHIHILIYIYIYVYICWISAVHTSWNTVRDHSNVPPTFTKISFHKTSPWPFDTYGLNQWDDERICYNVTVFFVGWAYTPKQSLYKCCFVTIMLYKLTYLKWAWKASGKMLPKPLFCMIGYVIQIDLHKLVSLRLVHLLEIDFKNSWTVGLT